MKKILISMLIIIPALLLAGCGNSENKQNYEAQKLSSVNTENQNNTANQPPSSNQTPAEEPKQPNEESKPPIEETLYEFSTPIKAKSENRLNNIRLTCEKLNETIVENESEFSFCNTVGQATSSKGYKKADVIINKRTVQAIGGGMCQVSTTLYNAVLGVQNLEVTERHSHDKPVNYIEDGKDATISYGSLDFKFKNHTGKKIKIYSSSDNVNVTVKIVSIS